MSDAKKLRAVEKKLHDLLSQWDGSESDLAAAKNNSAKLSIRLDAQACCM